MTPLPALPSNPSGREVHGDAIEPFRRVSERLTGSQRTLFEGNEHLLEQPDRFSWNECCALYEKIEELSRGHTTTQECGHALFESHRMMRMLQVVGVIASPSLLYTLGHRFGFAKTFSHLEIKQTQVSSRLLRIEIQIPPSHRDCRPFFELTQGILEAFPTLIGLGQSTVDLELSPRQGIFWVTFPPAQTIFVRLARTWRALFAGKATLEQLTEQQIALNQQLRQLRETHSRLARAHDELEEAHAHTRQALAVKRRFLSIMSHELRTPLNGISGSLALLRREDNAEARANLLEVCEESTRAMTRMIEGILELAHADGSTSLVEATPYEVDSLIENAIQDAKEACVRRGLEFTCTIKPSAPKQIEVDGSRLTQVIDRILENAVKFTPRGSISVEVDFDDQLIIRVRDSGIGMAPESRERIFELFTQLDDQTTRRHEGTGLGLALAHHQIRLLGGAIETESEVGRGSIFSIRVPVHVLEKRTTYPQKPLAGRGILVVDDNRINRLIITRMVKKLGWLVQEAENGAEAVKVAAENDFAAIFMDCEMPIMNGWEATERILEHHHGIPIIAVTAYVSDDDRARCRQAGMCDFLPKPISPDVVARTLERWTNHVSPSGTADDSKSSAGR